MSYQKIRSYTKIENSSVSKLIEMAILLERCATFLQQACGAIAREDFEGRFIATDKVIVLMSSLQNVLAVDRTQEAKEFHAFFGNVISLLVQVNLKNDIKLCMQIREKLIEMAQLWREADKTLVSTVNDALGDVTKDTHLESLQIRI